MSTILEALKRSEAMRSAAQGRSGGQQGVGYRAAPTDRLFASKSILLLGFVLIVVVLCAGWWYISKLTIQNNATAQVEQPVVSANPASGSSSQAANGGRSSGNAAPLPGQPTERPRATSELNDSARERLQALSQQRRETVWTTGGGAEREGAHQARPASDRAAVDRPQEAPVARTTPPDRRHRMPENTISWQEFVRNYRRRPPEVTLTAHRYHSEPQKRLAIINMKRYSPGERVSPESVLRDIVPQGVVLIIDGQNVLLEASQ